MKTESPALNQSDLVSFGQTSNIGHHAVAAISAATMILEPKRSWQAQPTHDVRNERHPHSLPRGLSALFPAKYLSTAHGFPLNLQFQILRSANVHLFTLGSNPNYQHGHSRL